MRHSDWMIDVLKDMETFAAQNGLEGSADALQKAMDIVLREIKQKSVTHTRPRGAVDSLITFCRDQ